MKVLLLLLLAVPVFAQENWVSVLDPAQGWSYIDAAGATRIPGPFSQADDFSDGLGRVLTLDGKVIFLDGTGKTVFEPGLPWASTSSFVEGRAWFVRDGRMGFFDTKGNQIIPPVFVPEANRRDGQSPFEPSLFHQGLAPVREVQTVGWLKKDGTFVKAPGTASAAGSPLGAQFTGLGQFGEGRAAWLDGKLFGLVDENGKIIAPGTWDEVVPFSEGLAAVRRGDLWGFIDRQGKEVIPLRFEAAFGFSGGLAVISENSKWNLVDKKGNTRLKEGFEELSPAFVDPSEAGLWVFTKDGKKGLLDGSGKVVAPPQFDSLFTFQEGAALVGTDGKFGLIDRQGRLVVPLQFAELGELHSGLAAYREGKLWGYLDARGKTVLSPQWDWAGDFTGGLAPVQKENKGALIDPRGKNVTPFIYEEVHNLQGGRRLVKQDGRYGYLNEKGLTVVAPRFSLAVDYGDGKALVYENGRVFFIDLQGRELFTGRGLPLFNLASIPDSEPTLVALGGKTGFVDPRGHFVFPPVYDQVLSAENGIALVGLLTPEGGRWFYADPQGKELYQEKKIRPYSGFSQERAFVVLSDPPPPGTDPAQAPPLELGVVDINGDLLTEGLLDEYGGFQEGAAAVKLRDGKWGFLGLDGKKLFEDEFDQAYPFSGGLAAVIRNNLFGFVDKTGKTALDFRFERTAPFRNGMAWVVEKGREAYVGSDGRVIWASPKPISVSP